MKLSASISIVYTETVSMYMYIGHNNTGYIYNVLVLEYAYYSSIRYVLEYSSIGHIYDRYIYRGSSIHSQYKIINSVLVY